MEEVTVNERLVMNDPLLDGFTFGELITAVQSNEPEVNEKSVRKVFDEILKAQIEDAKYLLKKNMKDILKEVCKYR